MKPAITLLLLAASVFSQNTPPAKPPHRMQVTLERYEGSRWKTVEPGLILNNRDQVRFRFKANFSGYLYVTNRSTSETTTLLFPRQDTGSENRVIANREYIVPAAENGSFRVEGPEGHDIVSWMVSPVSLGRIESPPTPPAPAGKLIPRCDDTIFRARGTCVDSSAGPQAKAAAKGEDAVMFIRERDTYTISAASPITGPIVYQFHLAHR